MGATGSAELERLLRFALAPPAAYELTIRRLAAVQGEDELRFFGLLRECGLHEIGAGGST